MVVFKRTFGSKDVAFYILFVRLVWFVDNGSNTYINNVNICHKLSTEY